MIILCDMDDVMENLAEAWINELNRIYGKSIKLNDVHVWELGEYYPDLTSKQIYDVLLDEKVWDNVRPKEGAVEYLKKLCEEHEVWVVTSTHYKNIDFKVKYVLERYFPFIPIERVIIAHNKQMIKGDFLIDDNPWNLVGGEYTPILFDSHHNQNAKGLNRCKSWKEVYEFIETSI